MVWSMGRGGFTVTVRHLRCMVLSQQLVILGPRMYFYLNIPVIWNWNMNERGSSVVTCGKALLSNNKMVK